MATKIKKGALHKQLNIPLAKKIPKTLIKRIDSVEHGTIVHNPTKIGDKIIHVTPKMKKRVRFVASFM